MRFADIKGHEAVKETLRNMVDTDRVAHAILLSGRPGIGKMKMARALAQYLQCTDRHDGDACGKCNSCRLHQTLNHPDLHFSYPIRKIEKKRTTSEDYIDEWKQLISETPYMPFDRWLELIDAGNSQPLIHVNESNEIVRRLSLSAFSSRFKINIIWLPEKLQLDAANKLLKIIEEPHPDTVFILVSDNPAAILPTILSRTRRIAMQALSELEVASILTEMGISAGDAADAARLCGGDMNKALALSDNAGEPTQFMREFQDMMRNAYSCKIAILKAQADRMADWGREKQRRYLDYCARMLRENFIYNLHQPALNLQTDAEEAFSTRFAPFIHAGNIEEMCRQTDLAVRDISRNGNAKLVFFDYLLHIMVQIRRKPGQ